MNDKYGLSFITDEDIFNHAKATIEKYRFTINLKEFNKNLVDPIKLTFDSKIYGHSIEKTIDSETIRQIDKSNTNHIGYFHQNIFKYFDGWEVPEEGFDVINEHLNIFVEMKNKHNTMNSSSAKTIYGKMQDKILMNDRATCYLVEVIAKNSQDITWVTSLNKVKRNNRNIRRASIDQFYKLVTGVDTAFMQVCEVLPRVIDDVISQDGLGEIKNSVFDELKSISPNITKNLFLSSFGKYEGFEDLDIE